jgi:hypothetical protein
VILAACDYLNQMEKGEGVCQRQSAFQPLVDAAIVRAIGRVLAEGVPGETKTGVPSSIVVATASWAIYGAVKEWFSSPGRVPAEEMVGTVLELVVPILQPHGVAAAAL